MGDEISESAEEVSEDEPDTDESIGGPDIGEEMRMRMLQKQAEQEQNDGDDGYNTFEPLEQRRASFE